MTVNTVLERTFPDSQRVTHGEIASPRGRDSSNKAAVCGLVRGLRESCICKPNSVIDWADGFTRAPARNAQQISKAAVTSAVQSEFLYHTGGPRVL